jgi:NAD(P)-dependent dehydrogenase (short-subunit alcohol dehydrogenase family)
LDYDFARKVAAISGGSRGIGLATARRLAECGASIAFAGRHPHTVDAAVAELTEIAARAGVGGAVLGAAVDLMTVEGVQAFVARTVERFGGVDILVNSVGDSSYGPFLEMTDEMVVSSWTVKVLTAVRLTRALVPIMERRGGGAIVNISGGAGREPQPGGIPAALANAGIRVFSKGGAADLARRGIAVNSISPGLVATDRHVERARAAAAAQGESVETILREWDIATPTGRVSTPEEVAELVIFLASRRVYNLTGAEIVLDGGAGRAV